MRLGAYRSVIWDWNGTLLDDVELALGVANELLHEHALPSLTEDRYKQIFDFPVRRYYERAGFDLERLDFNELSRRFCTRFEGQLGRAPLFPAAQRVLDDIRRSGTRQFLLSNTEHGALHRMLLRYGLDRAFDGIQGMADSLASGKTAGGRELLRQHRIDPEGAVLIGDTVHDAEVAEALGIDCLLLCTGHHSRERLADLGHPVLRSLDELP